MVPSNFLSPHVLYYMRAHKTKLNCILSVILCCIAFYLLSTVTSDADGRFATTPPSTASGNTSTASG